MAKQKFLRSEKKVKFGAIWRFSFKVKTFSVNAKILYYHYFKTFGRLSIQIFCQQRKFPVVNAHTPVKKKCPAWVTWLTVFVYLSWHFLIPASVVFFYGWVPLTSFCGCYLKLSLNISISSDCFLHCLMNSIHITVYISNFSYSF